jgi:hypothetical protein
MKPVNYDELTRSERRDIREQYIHEQKGRCYFCDEDLYDEPIRERKVNKELFPNGFFDYPIHLHHNHSTGMTIGAVHAYCNAVLWEYHSE